MTRNYYGLGLVMRWVTILRARLQVQNEGNAGIDLHVDTESTEIFVEWHVCGHEFFLVLVVEPSRVPEVSADG